MKNCATILLVLSAVCLSILAVPAPRIARRAAPESDCTQSTRTLREGLDVFRNAAKPANYPAVFLRDQLTFGSKTTALEFICENFETLRERSQQSSDLFQQEMCSWLNSFDGTPLFPDCSPIKVELFCRQVRIYTLSHRLGQYAGSVNNPSPTSWINTLLTQQTTIPRPVRDFICSLYTSGMPCV